MLIYNLHGTSTQGRYPITDLNNVRDSAGISHTINIPPNDFALVSLLIQSLYAERLDDNIIYHTEPIGIDTSDNKKGSSEWVMDYTNSFSKIPAYPVLDSGVYNHANITLDRDVAKDNRPWEDEIDPASYGNGITPRNATGMYP